MAVTDYKSPGTQVSADRDSKVEWTNPTNAASSNDSDAVCAVGKDTYSDWLRLTNFGFTSTDIPVGSTIDGIEVSIECMGDSNDIEDSAIYLRDSTSTQVGDNKASATLWPDGVDGFRVYGGAIDTWGAGLDQADIVSSNFGIDISALNTTGTGTRDASVDHVKIRVYYTEPVTTTSTSTTSTSSSSSTSTSSTSSSSSTSTTSTSSSTSTTSTSSSSSTSSTSSSSSTSTTSTSISTSTTSTSSSSSTSSTSSSSSTSTTSTSSSSSTSTTSTSSSSSTSTTSTSSSSSSSTSTTSTSSSTSTTSTSSSTSTSSTSSSTSTTSTSSSTSSTSSSTSTTSTSSSTSSTSSSSSTSTTSTSSSSSTSTTSTSSSSSTSTTSSSTSSTSSSSSTSSTSSSSSTSTTSTSSSTSTSSTSSSSSTSSTSSSSSTSSTSTSTSTTTTLPFIGCLAFGEENPTEGEIPISWQTWDGTGIITGDTDWGKLALDDSEYEYSQVYDHGEVIERQYTITRNVYGTGQGTSTLYYRGSVDLFGVADELPEWTQYTGTFLETYRYVQIKEEK